MLNYVACDPSIKVVNLFHLVDESDLGGWQSGLYYVGYAPKASAGAVSQWIAQTGGNCTGTSKRWTPAGGSAATGATPDEATAAKLEQYRKLGLFNGMDAGTAGDLQSFVTQPDVETMLSRLFAPAPNLQEAFGSVVSSFRLVPAYFAFVSSQGQAGNVPNIFRASQLLVNVMQIALGNVLGAMQVQVSTFLCGSNCSSDAWANVGVLPGFATRTPASASAKAAPRAVAVGKATVRAGKQLKVKMRAVKGAKRAYGRYVLVLRMRPLSGSAEPATIAVTYRVAKAKPAKKASHAKQAKAAHGNAQGKAAKPKPAKKH
jgi:hypothetical protein